MVSNSRGSRDLAIDEKSGAKDNYQTGIHSKDELIENSGYTDIRDPQRHCGRFLKGREIKQGAATSEMFPETGGIDFRYLSLFIDTILCEVIIGPSSTGGTVLAMAFQVFVVGYPHPV